jgi:hypothetical protein
LHRLGVSQSLEHRFVEQLLDVAVEIQALGAQVGDLRPVIGERQSKGRQQRERRG